MQLTGDIKKEFELNKFKEKDKYTDIEGVSSKDLIRIRSRNNFKKRAYRY